MARKTALYDRHVQLGARMVDFAGWVLPVQYPTGPIAEHRAVRADAGLFDIDHMGQVMIEGREALPFLQAVMTADVSRLALGSAHYSLMCYDDGGIVDDTFIYNLGGKYMVAVNASNNEKDTRWLDYHKSGFEVVVRNVSDETYMLALQGPQAETILQAICSADLNQLAYHRCVETAVAGVCMLVGRTGYTGEDGFELFFPADQALRVWDGIMEQGKPHGLVPIGLAARDSLRLEPCMPLYGQEISASIDPFAAGLGWAVALGKGGWCGRGALLKAHLEGPHSKLVGFEMMQGGVPRHGYKVLVDDMVVGEVTSGIYSPTLDKYIGLAYVSVEHGVVGTTVGIAIRDKVKPAIVVRRPFYTPSYRR